MRLSPFETNPARIAEAVADLQRKRQGEVTLTANAASTTVEDMTVLPESRFQFDPLTSNAALEKAAGTMFVTTANRLKHSFVITHANNSQTDRTFRWTVIGS